MSAVTINTPTHVFGFLSALIKRGVHLVDLSDGQALHFPVDAPAIGLCLTPPPEPKRKQGMGFAPLAEPGELCMPEQVEIDGLLYLKKGVPIPDTGVDTGMYSRRSETTEDDTTVEKDQEAGATIFLVYLRIGNDNLRSRWEKIMQKAIAEYNKRKPADSPEVEVVIRSTFKPPARSKEDHRLAISCGGFPDKEEE